MWKLIVIGLLLNVWALHFENAPYKKSSPFQEKNKIIEIEWSAEKVDKTRPAQFFIVIC